MTAESLNAELVGQLRQQNAIRSEEVERAFLSTPRHLFLPSVDVNDVYQDRAIATKFDQSVAISSCSQPAIVAIMLEQLALRAGVSVLEIGAGTGYNAALLGHVVGPAGRVITLDIDDDTVMQASRHLQAAHVSNVLALCLDGGEGFAPSAPFDRIVLSVSASDICPAWFTQLADGGVIVLPLWLGARQYAIAFDKTGGRLHSSNIQPCGFMTLRGNFAGPRVWHPVDEFLVGGEALEILDLTAIASRLSEPPRVRALQSAGLPLADLLDYMAASRVPLFSLLPMRGGGDSSLDFGLSAGGDGFVLLRGTDLSASRSISQVVQYGDDAAWIELQNQIERFVAAGRPSIAHGSIESAPHGTPLDAPLVLCKRWMDYGFRPLYPF